MPCHVFHLACLFFLPTCRSWQDGRDNTTTLCLRVFSLPAYSALTPPAPTWNTSPTLQRLSTSLLTCLPALCLLCLLSAPSASAMHLPLPMLSSLCNKELAYKLHHRRENGKRVGAGQSMAWHNAIFAPDMAWFCAARGWFHATCGIGRAAKTYQHNACWRVSSLSLPIFCRVFAGSVSGLGGRWGVMADAGHRANHLLAALLAARAYRAHRFALPPRLPAYQHIAARVAQSASRHHSCGASLCAGCRRRVFRHKTAAIRIIA